MGVGQAINTAREAANKLSPSTEAVKSAAVNTCNGMIETCKGSGSVRTEGKKIVSAMVDAPLTTVTHGLKACTELLTLQPVKATCTAARGLTDMCKNVAKVCVSPVPMSIAALKTTGKAATEVIKFPVTGPLKAYDVTKRGVIKATDIMFGPDSPVAANDNTEAAPANDNASAPPAAPNVARAA